MNNPEAPLYFKISIKSLLFVIERLTVFEMIWYDRNMIAITNTKNKKTQNSLKFLSPIGALLEPYWSPIVNKALIGWSSERSEEERLEALLRVLRRVDTGRMLEQIGLQ